MSAYIISQNAGGVMVSIVGHSSFLPKSHMSKELYQTVCKDCKTQEVIYSNL